VRNDYFYARLRVAARAFVATEQQVTDKMAPEIGAGLNLLYGAARDMASSEIEAVKTEGIDPMCRCSLCVNFRLRAMKAREAAGKF
jgi:hypothetical protein